MLVAVGHCLEKDFTGVSRLLFVIVTLLDDTIEQLSSQHLFSDQVVELLLLKDIVESNDIAVFQLGENIDFILQSLLILWCKLGLGHNLDGEGLPGLLVGTFLYN